MKPSQALAFRDEQTKDPRLASIPVVIMTADGKIEGKLNKLKLSEYLKKPLEIDDLLKTAQRYCA